MIIRGKLVAETPIYRGNARKTLFTRDGDGSQRLVSLAGEISGTAQALMDAFIGQSRDGRNIGLLNRSWQRLYGDALPDGLITRVDCRLQDAGYAQDHFFDLRMGLKLDEDRWASEANANYKMETVFRNAAFDFSMMINDAVLERGENRARLYYLLQEMREGRFWFGAGKSKGLGRVRLEAEIGARPPRRPTCGPTPTISRSSSASTPTTRCWSVGTGARWIPMCPRSLRSRAGCSSPRCATSRSRSANGWRWSSAGRSSAPMIGSASWPTTSRAPSACGSRNVRAASPKFGSCARRRWRN